MFQSHASSLVLRFVVCSTLLSASGLSVAQESARTNTGAVVEEVIVTAQKRQESGQEVPVSLAVVGAEQIANLQLVSGTELARQTPNLQVSNLGNEDQPKFSLRGISTPDFNLNTTSPTGVFYDEVYIASNHHGSEDFRRRILGVDGANDPPQPQDGDIICRIHHFF